jgi:hypothetical protein
MCKILPVDERHNHCSSLRPHVPAMGWRSFGNTVLNSLASRSASLRVGSLVEVVGGSLDGLRGTVLKISGGLAVIGLGEVLGVSLIARVNKIRAVSP